jgi:hypothetical protein
MPSSSIPEHASLPMTPCILLWFKTTPRSFTQGNWGDGNVNDPTLGMMKHNPLIVPPNDHIVCVITRSVS